MSTQGSIFDEDPIPDIPQSPEVCPIGEKPAQLSLNQKIMDFFLTLGLAITEEEKTSVGFETSQLKVLLLSKLIQIPTINAHNYMAEFERKEYQVKIKKDITNHSPECKPLVWQIRALIKTQKEASESQIESAREAILNFIKNGGRLNLELLKEASVRVQAAFLDRLTETILALRKEYKAEKLKAEQEHQATTLPQNSPSLSYTSQERTLIEPPSVFISQNLSLKDMHELASFRAARTPQILR